MTTRPSRSSLSTLLFSALLIASSRGSFSAGAVVPATSPPAPALPRLPDTPSTGEGHRQPRVGSAPQSVTLPFVLDHNRMIVEVELLRADGTVRKARAWVDTGNPYLVLGEELARDLGLEIAPPNPEGGQDGRAWATRTPQMLLRGLPITVEGVKTQIRTGARPMPGVPGEVNLPASALRRHLVVLDYPKGELTVARPGSAPPRGLAIPCRVHAETGLFQIETMADGEAVSLGVDNGSSSTWISDSLTTAWAARHPEWPRARGAVGTTNFFGFAFEAEGALTRLPELRLGTLTARDVTVLGLPQGLFDWYSKKTAGPVAGFLGANVLRRFRIEVDYPGQMTYWEAGPPSDPADLDLVGLTLRPESNGTFTVAGVAIKDGTKAVAGVEPGDRLVRVGPLEIGGVSMGEAVNALRGKPGSSRTLVLERNGKRIEVEARVLRFP